MQPDAPEVEDQQPRVKAKPWNPFRQHGSPCRCATTSTLADLPLAASYANAIGKVVGRAPPNITLWFLMVDARRVIPEELQAVLDKAIHEYAVLSCPYDGTDTPTTPWRTYTRPGLETREERWPDDWDGVDWSRIIDETAGITAGHPQPNSVRQSTYWGLRSLLIPRERTASESGEYRLASSPWEWDSVEDLYVIDPDGWSLESRLRALWAVREEQRDHAARALAIRRIAAREHRGEVESRMFLEYVDACDRGVQVPDVDTRAVLLRYPEGCQPALGRRLEMIDAFAPPEHVHDGDTEEQGRAETPEPPITLPWYVEVAKEDGQPNPLAEVRKLLPGGPGVRGRPPIVYTPTALDSELLPYLQTVPPTLVVLSGNAGDGKTAFIDSVLEVSGVRLVPGRNEYQAILNGRSYLVVLDGSEDSEDRSNEQLLEDALGRFAGDGPRSVDRGTLIAVNKGRLLAFLERHAGQFAYLWSSARDRFVWGREPAGSPYVYLDLNDRSVAAPSEDLSLAAGVVTKLANWEGWQSCESCDAQAACPVLFNVESLRRPPTAAQLWRVLAAIDLDDRIHVTARHLVTKVASLVVGDGRCPEIRATAASGQFFDATAYFYNSTFQVAGGAAALEDAVIDRVSSDYDPTLVSAPRTDQQVAIYVARGALGELLGDERAPDADRLLAEAVALEGRTIDKPAEPGELEYRQALVNLTAEMRRRLFFLSPEHPLTPAFPLRSVDEFFSLSEPAPDEAAVAVRHLLASLNATLGIDARGLEGLIVPKDYSRGLAGTGFALLVPNEHFRVAAGTALGGTYAPRPFMASWPRSILLLAEDARGNEVARLSIPLLMYEILVRSNAGFRPISQTERNFMVRLQGFYRAVSSSAWLGRASHVLYENGRISARASFNRDGVWIGAA